MNKVLVLAAAGVWLSGSLAAGQVVGQSVASQAATSARPGNQNNTTSEMESSVSFPDRGQNGNPLSGEACPGPGEPSADCPSPVQGWAHVDYLLWWLKPVCLKPPTLTVGSPADAVPGAVGQPHTQVVQGDHKFEFNGASGIRPSVGVWLTADQFLSLEAEGFLLEQAAASESFRSAGGGTASFIPFQDPGNVNQALPFSIPGVVNGSSVAIGRSRLWGLESNLAGNFCTSKEGLVFSGAVLIGFRYLDLEDRVNVTNQQDLVANPATFAFGSDEFATRNQFYGPQVGTRLGISGGAWSLDLLTKMALGITHQVSQVTGQPLLGGTLISPLLLPGPFLALASNVGRQSANRITLVPEMALTVHYRLTEQVSLSLGYSGLYWNKVLCPGDQMDGHVNVTQLPFHGPVTGPLVPAPMLVHTDAFAQGVNAGVEFQF